MAPLHKAQTQTIQHFSHPSHPLQQVYIAADYKCDGCNTVGSGSRYRCHTCDFDLHECCATCPFSIMSPLHPQHPLTLVNKLGKAHFCNFCGNIATGIFYTCTACDFDVHPLCSQQQLHITGGSHSQFTPTLGPQAQAEAAVLAHLAAVQAQVAAIQAQAARQMAAPSPYGGYAVGVPSSSYQTNYQQALNQYQVQPSGSRTNGSVNNGSSVSSVVGKLAVKTLVSSIIGFPLG